MVLECGKVPREIPMLVNGSLEKLMDMEFTLGLMVIVMKVNLRTVSNMVKVYKNSQMETYIKVSMYKENHQDLDNIIGRMEVILKVRLRWVYDVVMEYGRKDLEIVTNMRDNILMIKSQVTVFSHGQVVMYTREIMKMTLEMVMEKCIGWMAVFIKVIGGMEYNMVKVKFMSLVKESKRDFSKIIH